MLARPHRFLTTLFGLALASAAAPALVAQSGLQFDVIAFDDVVMQGGSGAQGCSMSFGLVVNTGSVPIPLSAWQDGLTFGTSTAAANALFFDQYNPFGGNQVLMPGQAVGHVDPLLTGLLNPGETLLHPSSALALNFQVGGGPVGTTQQFALYAQAGDKRARIDTQVTFVTQVTCDQLSAQRFSAVLSDAEVATLGPSCALPTGALTLQAIGAGDWGGTTTALNSNMPVIGNPHFALAVDGVLDDQIGQPHVLVVGLPSAPFAIQGCDVWIDFAAPTFLKAGTIGVYCPVPFACSAAQPIVDLPIPSDTSLVGAVLAAQWTVLTPLAANGLFAASNGLRITIGQAP
jgi:hypothetical protein